MQDRPRDTGTPTWHSHHSQFVRSPRSRFGLGNRRSRYLPFRAGTGYAAGLTGRQAVHCLPTPESPLTMLRLRGRLRGRGRLRRLGRSRHALRNVRRSGRGLGLGGTVALGLLDLGRRDLQAELDGYGTVLFLLVSPVDGLRLRQGGGPADHGLKTGNVILLDPETPGRVGGAGLRLASLLPLLSERGNDTVDLQLVLIADAATAGDFVLGVRNVVSHDSQVKSHDACAS